MSQNKFMHPRNIYRKPPSFKDMAIEYPDFRKFAKPDISGKITIDFKDPESLRALTTTLLLKDFGLHVDIPLTRLIPTLPLRLNYLLWLEDLLDVIGIQRSEYISVRGIDIGTGASCIYPLLAAKQNSWHMTATEIDHESFKIAEKNVNDNNLLHLVSVKLVNGDKLLKDIVQEDEDYTFSMCNPPFFSSEQELDYSSKSRSPCRPPPSNGTTGNLKELVAPGGEVAFILKMMNESNQLRTKVRIYSTMVGHKSSLPLLKLELKKLKVASMAETRFCQGKTTRWGIAWTYHTNFSLGKAYQTPSQKKSNTPMTYVVPPEAVSIGLYTVETVYEKVTNLLSELEVQHKLKKKNNFMIIMDITAIKNTWSHQRRKKRQCATQELQHEKEKNSNESEAYQKDDKDTNILSSEESTVSMKKRVLNDAESDEYSSKKIKTDDNTVLVSLKENFKSSTDNNSPTDVQEDTCSDSLEESLVQKNSVVLDSVQKLPLSVPLLEASVFVRNLASEIHIEFLWKGGSGGRESMHQVLQYIKNRLK